MIHLRPATPDDASLIADISHETFSETFAAHNTKADMDKFFSIQFSKAQLIAEVGAPGNTFILAYAGDEPAGYLFLKENSLHNAPAIEISRLYARSAFIGKKVGKTLMEAAIDFARLQNKDWLWLGVWEHNHRAIDFYKTFGFEKFGTHDFLLGDDLQVDWEMRRKA